MCIAGVCETCNAVFCVGDFWSVSVGQEGGHVRGGGHVRAAHRHDTQRVPHANRSQQRPEPRLQRRAVCLQKGMEAVIIYDSIRTAVFAGGFRRMGGLADLEQRGGALTTAEDRSRSSCLYFVFCA